MNNQQEETPIQCSACGHQFATTIYSYVDVTHSPQAKAMLLSGRLNNAICPNCGTPNTIATPVLYHDPTKELLIAHVPLELNLDKDGQERAIGQLMNRMPKDDFKGYMFNPRRAMTMQGLIEQVLEADGITPEMLQEQRDRVQFVQQFIEATSEESLADLVAQHDEAIDEAFFQTITAIAQRMVESGQMEVAQGVIAIQQRIVELSTYGQSLLERQEQQQAVVQDVANEIEALGPGANREDFFSLVARYREQDEYLQALVGMTRPAFDYEFFQMMTMKISQAPANERDSLERLRQRILDLTTAIDQQQQQAMQQAAGLLQAMVNHAKPAEMVEANAHLIDDLFMQVLEMNIQQAEQTKNIQLLTRLKEVQQVVLSLLQSQMQPELLFINQLLGAQSEADIRQMIESQGAEFGPALLETIDAVERILEQQGDNEMSQRLNFIKSTVTDMVSQ